MEKKYEFTDETLEHNGHILHRIKALRDFGNVNEGELGGWLENESNLSQEDDCWVYDDAMVFGEAGVFGHAKVYDDAVVYGWAWIYDEAKVYHNVQVFGHAEVYGDVRLYGKAKVFDNAMVFGNADITGDAVIKDMTDYMVFQNTWSSGRFFTWTRSNNMWRAGCFYGTGEELIKKAYEDSEEKGEYYKLYVELVEKVKEIHQKYAK